MAKRDPIIRIIVTMLVAMTLCAVFLLTLPDDSNPKPKRRSLKRSYSHILSENRQLSIVFAGDLMQHMPQVNAALNDDGEYDYTECFNYVAPLFKNSDLTVVNLETTLTEKSYYSGYPSFSSPVQLAAGMKEAGIDVALLANNHICDKRGTGIESTLKSLDSTGIHYTGAFNDSTDYSRRNPLTLRVNDFNVNILNYTYGTNGIPVPKGKIVNLIDTLQIAEDLLRIKPDPYNLTFVCIHWGYEYHTRENSEQKRLAQWLRDKGVDFIIGSHPHVIQPSYVHADSTGTMHGITVYSLGNFVSNQQSLNTDGGMILRLDIFKRRTGKAEVTPGYAFGWTYKTRLEGKNVYRILPSYMADEILAQDSLSRMKYDKFVGNARKILKNSGMEEISAFP